MAFLDGTILSLLNLILSEKYGLFDTIPGKNLGLSDSINQAAPVKRRQRNQKKEKLIFVPRR
jgi:hypothetical protein